MPEQTPPTNCPNCQSPLVQKPSKFKQGDFFWGCSNYPNCKYIWHADRKPQDNTEELIFRQQMKEGLKIINENIQKIIEMLKEK